MDIAAYAVEAEVEASHWWFIGRRRLFSREITALGLPQDPQILDVGTSTGTNLRMLRDLGFQWVTGLDLSDEAIRFCAEKKLGNVRRGDVCALPFADASFDLALATDILEHVVDDGLALHEIARVLKPGARALITVPAFESLWGLQDEVAHHLRRYRLPAVRTALEMNGLRPVRCYYFNYLLFGPIWLARQILRRLNIRLTSENRLNSPLLNRLLTVVFDFDLHTAPRLTPPFGVSIFILAEKFGKVHPSLTSHLDDQAGLISSSDPYRSVGTPLR